mmetsp:Transcript_6758/g.6069  ORF Transcript_6758/g.6069 Transcript_6758/m.6069 type:complete len:106 (+) Transcript_6758:111-428(+)
MISKEPLDQQKVVEAINSYFDKAGKGDGNGIVSNKTISKPSSDQWKLTYRIKGGNDSDSISIVIDPNGKAPTDQEKQRFGKTCVLILGKCTNSWYRDLDPEIPVG